VYQDDQVQQKVEELKQEMQIDEDEIPFWECLKCGFLVKVEEIIDAEDDGDMCGKCPSCKGYGIFLEAGANGWYKFNNAKWWWCRK
jgi:rubrerythrin